MSQGKSAGGLTPCPSICGSWSCRWELSAHSNLTAEPRGALLTVSAAGTPGTGTGAVAEVQAAGEVLGEEGCRPSTVSQRPSPTDPTLRFCTEPAWLDQSVLHRILDISTISKCHLARSRLDLHLKCPSVITGHGDPSGSFSFLQRLRKDRRCAGSPSAAAVLCPSQAPSSEPKENDSRQLPACFRKRFPFLRNFCLRYFLTLWCILKYAFGSFCLF